jgi:hypothetical protein
MPANAIDKTGLLIEQVKKETNTKEAINLLADIILEGQSANMEYMKTISDSVNKINVILTGNGHPEDSMCTRLKDLERKVTWLFGLFGTVGTAIVLYVVIELVKLI